MKSQGCIVHFIGKVNGLFLQFTIPETGRGPLVLVRLKWKLVHFSKSFAKKFWVCLPIRLVWILRASLKFKTFGWLLVYKKLNMNVRLQLKRYEAFNLGIRALCLRGDENVGYLCFYTILVTYCNIASNIWWWQSWDPEMKVTETQLIVNGPYVIPQWWHSHMGHEMLQAAKRAIYELDQRLFSSHQRLL